MIRSLKNMTETYTKSFIGKLPRKLQWAPHNILAHPMMEVCHWAGLPSLGNWVHEVTTPPSIRRKREVL